MVFGFKILEKIKIQKELHNYSCKLSELKVLKAEIYKEMERLNKKLEAMR